METFWQDVKYAWRMLKQKPGFTLVAVLTLALGIGVNTALFSLLHAVVGKRIAGVEDGAHLVWVSQTDLNNRNGQVSYPDYVHYRDHNTSFAGLTAYARISLSLGTGGEPERVRGQIVTGNYFDVLRVRLAQGRGFLPEEDRTPGTPAVAVISHRLWERRFDSNPNILGKTIVLNGHSFAVVGVAPKGFTGTEFEDAAEVWVPTMMHRAAMPRPADALEQSTLNIFYCFGRLKPDVGSSVAEAELRALAGQLPELYPQTHKGLAVSLEPMLGWLHPSDRGELPPLVLLCGTVTGLVLLITCANLGTLLLSRGVSRGREIAIRLALGAGRRRIVQQLLTENLLLATAGAAAGLLLSFWAADIVLAVFQLPAMLDPSPDVTVLIFATVLALLATLAFGLAPALHAARSDLVPVMKGEVLPAAGRSRSRLQRVFVVGQVALSALLLVIAGLFLRTLQSASRIDVGFTGRNDVLAMSIDLGLHGYDAAASEAFYQQLLLRSRALPGVQAASLANNVPLSSTMIATEVEMEGESTGSPGRRPRVFFNLVRPDFFRTIGTPLLRGRDFGPQDDAVAPGVLIVNETMAARFWPGENPLGKRLRMAGEDKLFEVVGVARDGKYDEFGERPPAHMFLPHAQYSDGLAGMILLVRAGGDARGLIEPLKATVHQMDANLPVYRVRTLGQYIEDRLDDRRKGTALLGVFGGVALGLAMIGVYGVMAFHMTQRTREIGIRMALGAQKGDVLRLFLGQGLRFALAGVAVGLSLALAAAGLLRNLLFGISPLDPATFAGVALLLGAAALLAAFLPARRATQVDPIVALRYE